MFFQDDPAERSDAYRLLADLFSKHPQDDDLEVIKRDLELGSGENAAEILDEFNSLLRYPGGKLAPIESLYSEAVDVDIVTSVSGFYASAGLMIEEEFEAPPDHLSLELLFISYLVDTEDLTMMENFLDEHIMNWVPYYCKELKRQAQTVFYGEIADITRNFLESEYNSFM